MRLMSHFACVPVEISLSFNYLRTKVFLAENAEKVDRVLHEVRNFCADNQILVASLARPFNVRDHRREHMIGKHRMWPSAQALEATSENQKKYEHNTIGIFWDWENIPIPPVPVNKVPELLKKMRRVLLRYGSHIRETKIYHDSAKAKLPSGHAIKMEHRRPLQLTGWTMDDCACVRSCQTGGGVNNLKTVKEVVDKKIIVDIMEFAHDHLKDGCTVIIISNDADYGYLLSRLQNYGVYVVVVFSKNAYELTTVGDDAFDFSHFIDDDDDDNNNVDDETAINGPVDPPTSHDETADEDTTSETGAVVPGMHLSLLKAVEETCKNHEFSKRNCPGKALAPDVGVRLRAGSDIYDEETFNNRKWRAIRAGLIDRVWLRPDRTETKNQAEKQTGWDILFLTDKGLDSLNEAKRGELSS